MRFISLGTAASIRREIAIGEAVVCNQAFSDEGASRHYVAGKDVFPATQPLADRIRAHLNQRGLACKMGAAWTTDAPYRETARTRDAFRRKGAEVVEMEASALYMIAEHRGVEALSVFVVGDSIAGEKWEPHFNEKRIKLKLKRVGLELLEFLVGSP
jgi:purine-nucleoside phosphorylase